MSSEPRPAKTELELRRYYLFRPCETRDELRWWLITYMGLDLPDCLVDEDSNSTPLDMVWECYSKMRANNDENFSRVLYYACRDGFKTLSLAAIEVLAMVHLGRSAAHMAAIKEQATKSQSYVKAAFRRPYLRDFVVGDNETVTKIQRFYNRRTQHSLTVAEYAQLQEAAKTEHEEYTHLLAEYRERDHYVKVVVCTMAGANSEHVPLFACDELDVVSNKAAYGEAQNIPSPRAGKKALTILTSTRKRASGIVQAEINKAQEALARGEVILHIRHWNIHEITEGCAADRHQCGTEHEPGHCQATPEVVLYRNPDNLRTVTADGLTRLSVKEQEGYQEARGFPGCGDCKLFVGCKTRLATHQHSKSTFLNKIPDVIAKYRNQQTIDIAKAQLLCWKPETTGLVYPRFDKTRHVLSPAEAYFKVTGEEPPQGKRMTKDEFLTFMRTEREVQWYGGMDFGEKHHFVYVHGFKDGSRMFVTNVFASSNLGTDEQIANCEPYLDYDPVIYPDMADGQAIRFFRKAHFTMREWKKGPGSIMSGITAVEASLNPVHGLEPNLYFVHDVDEDSMMALMIRMVEEYHWKEGADGKPIYGTPQEEDDDEVDALRYLVMNVFPMKGQGVTIGTANSAAEAKATPAAVAGPNAGLDPNNWVRQKVAQLTGGVLPPPRPRMTIEAPQGSGYTSYYADEETGQPKAVPSKTGKKGKRQDAGEQPVAEGAGKSGRLTWNLG